MSLSFIVKADGLLPALTMFSKIVLLVAELPQFLQTISVVCGIVVISFFSLQVLVCHPDYFHIPL